MFEITEGIKIEQIGQRKTKKAGIWRLKSMYTLYQYYNLKNSLIVVCFSFLVKFLLIFGLISLLELPLVENKENFWRTSNASRRSDFPGHSVGSSSKSSLISIISSVPLLILPVSKKFVYISKS